MKYLICGYRPRELLLAFYNLTAKNVDEKLVTPRKQKLVSKSIPNLTNVH